MRFMYYPDHTSANYRGHYISIDPIDNPDSPRDEPHDLLFISTNPNYKSPDNYCVYEPTGNFYSDIFRFATGDLLGEVFNYDIEAESIVKETLHAIPVKVDENHSLQLAESPYEKNIFGAFVIAKAIENFNNAKYDAECQLKEYNHWLKGEVYQLSIFPDSLVYDTLDQLLGAEGKEILEEWENDLEPLGFEVIGDIADYNLTNLEQSLNALSDWVLSKIKNKIKDKALAAKIKKVLKDKGLKAKIKKVLANDDY